MYTSSAAQHLPPRSSPFYLVRGASATVSALKSSSSIATLRRLPSDSTLALANISSVTLLFSPSLQREASHPRALGERFKLYLPPLRAASYDEGEQDDVYVKSFKPSPETSQRHGPLERSSSKMGGRGRYNSSGQQDSDQFSSEAIDGASWSYQKPSTSAPGERSGFKQGFKDERRERNSRPFSSNTGGGGGSQRDSAGSRSTFSRSGGGEEKDNSSFRPGGKGQLRGGDRMGGRTAGRRREPLQDPRGNAVSGDRRRPEKELDGVSGEEVEYRHPDWKEDPKAERKRKKEPTVAPQVHFDSPMNKQPHVAILGGGMSGLVCAITLEERGIRSTVFDTGKHGLGGRMATRDIHVREGLSLVFDHAAQYFTASDSKFRKLVDRWVREGAAKEWKGAVGTLQAGGKFSRLVDGVPRFVGTQGMRYLADHIVSKGRLIEVKRPVWISNMDAKGHRWHLNENGKPHGEYDAVVVAHNGKCANRLLAPSGAPEVFKQMKRLELSSIWALMASFEEALPVPEELEGVCLEGAFVEGVNAVSWMANNSSKLDRADKSAPQCWTFFSTAAYGKKNKVPQESIPAVKAERVRKEMLQGAELALGLPAGSMPPPFFTKVQLWGAGLPTNTPGVPCIFDPIARVGICGDWLLGSSLEAAALSGMALAEHIADFRDRGELNPEEFSIGLQKGFSPVAGKDVGQFAGIQTLEPVVSHELVGSAH